MTLFRPVISQKTKDEVGELFPNVPHFGDKVNAMVHHYKVLKGDNELKYVALRNAKIIQNNLNKKNQALTSESRMLRTMNHALIVMTAISAISVLIYEVFK